MGKITRQELHDSLNNELGDLSTLKTTNKTSLVGAINESINEPAPVSATLNHGQNIVNVVEKALLNMGFTGRTLINLSGRSSAWSVNSSPLALKVGGNAIASGTIETNITDVQMTTTSNTAEQYASINQVGNLNYTLKANMYYIVLLDFKINSFSGANAYLKIGMQPPVGGTVAGDMTKTGVWQTAIHKYQVGTSDATGESILFGTCYAGGVFATFDVDVKNPRIFQITQAEYNALSTMTIDQIADKYPYVDDVKHYTNPYIIGYGKNLLPPFSQWSDNAASNGIITGSYSYSLTSTAMDQYISYDVKVLPNTSYILSATHNGWLGVYDVTNGSWIQQQITTSSVTFNTGTANTIRISFRNTTTTGTFTFTNPQLELGSTATTFVPRNDDNLFLQTSLCASLDGTVQDTAYQRDGQWYKMKRFENLVMDGTLTWGFSADNTGFKRVAISPLSNYDNHNYQAVKFDGTILGYGTSVKDDYYYDGTAHYITIADTDSGWGETYTPTAQEIQAYFYGWAMSATNTTPSPYTGTGTKYWYKVGTSPTTNGYYTTACPTVLVDNVYTPYKLTYQLVTSQEVAITAEGSLNVNEGLNQIELGEAVIVREPAHPILSGSSYWINGDTTPQSNLKYVVKSIIAVYKNGQVDPSWSIVSTTSNQGLLGNQQAGISQAKYDTTAAYSVTYIAIPYQLACSALPQNGSYDANLKTAVDNTIQRVTDLESEVTALQITKANRQQGQWIAPTLLNGWVNFDSGTNAIVGFMKNDIGIVRLKGLLKNGTTTVNTVLFYLPTGYRPTQNLRVPFTSVTGTSTIVNGYLMITPSGSVQIDTVACGNTYASIDGITFRAEQ